LERKITKIIFTLKKKKKRRGGEGIEVDMVLESCQGLLDFMSFSPTNYLGRRKKESLF
jgi:hypothetical protein